MRENGLLTGGGGLVVSFAAMKRILFLVVASATLAIHCSAADWVLADDLKTISYKGAWVFNCSGTMDRLSVNSIKSHPTEKTDIDFGTLHDDTGATVVGLGASLFNGNRTSYSGYVTSVALAPTIETLGNGLLAWMGSCTNFVIPPGSVLTAFPNAMLEGTAAFTIDASTIPSTITRFGNSCFNGKTIAGTLRIPAACTTIGSSAFSGATLAGGVEFEEGSVCSAIEYRAFYQSKFPGPKKSIEIPASVTTIGGAAFAWSQITSVTFADGSLLESIGDTAFYSAPIVSISLPPGLTSLGAQAFYSCGSLCGSVTIPKGIRSIGNSTFTDCIKLQEVVFEEGCTAIGSDVFANCTAITNIVLPRTLKTLAGGVLVGGSGRLASWRGMKKGDIWWQSAPEIADGGTSLFAYCVASNGGKAGAVVNHLSFSKWATYAAAHPDTFVLPENKKDAGTWTTPAAGTAGSSVTAILNWEIDPTVVLIR